MIKILVDRVIENDGVIRACRHGCLDVVKLLVELGANIRVQDDQALITAARSENNLEIVKFLLCGGPTSARGEVKF